MDTSVVYGSSPFVLVSRSLARAYPAPQYAGPVSDVVTLYEQSDNVETGLIVRRLRLDVTSADTVFFSLIRVPCAPMKPEPFMDWHFPTFERTLCSPSTLNPQCLMLQGTCSPESRPIVCSYPLQVRLGARERFVLSLGYPNSSLFKGKDTSVLVLLTFECRSF
jgi:hypothetical protein